MKAFASTKMNVIATFFFIFTVVWKSINNLQWHKLLGARQLNILNVNLNDIGYFLELGCFLELSFPITLTQCYLTLEWDDWENIIIFILRMSM